jgi:hypothetical protein
MTHAKRQATQLSCLPNLLNDGDTGTEIVCGEEKVFCTGLTRAAKAGQKVFCTATASPMNQPWKDPFHLYSLSPHSPLCHTNQQGPPLSSLSGRCMQGNRSETFPFQRTFCLQPGRSGLLACSTSR